MLLLRAISLYCAIVLQLSLNVNSQDASQFALTPESWPPGPGRKLVPQQPDAELISILRQVDPKRIKTGIEKLVSFGTRHTLSNQTDPVRGIGAARDWIASEMRKYAEASEGRMVVTVPSYVQGPAPRVPNDTVISNIIATLKGSEEPNRVYVISGHYDTRVTDPLDFTSDSPGANDDGSGTLISMELARIFARLKPKATIVFAVVAGEEQGLFGSTFLAQQLKNAIADVQGMLDDDIVGSSRGEDGIFDPFSIRMFVQGVPPTENITQVTSRVNIGAESDSTARQLGRFVSEVASNSATRMNVRTVYRPDRFLRGGDHLPFLREGFPAVRFTEPNEDYAHQHQDVRVDDSGKQFGDLIEFVDFEFVARVARVNGAALWSLAQAPGTPKDVKLDTSVLTNNSTLTWTLDPAADRYEIMWRASDSSIWTHVVPVGKTNTATVALSKDNAQFGVRAVGSNGYKSPAGFPFP